MATVTGMTAEKIVEITDDSLISASIDAATGVLSLQTRGGQTITAGNVGLASAAVDKAYPVGSIFMSTIATNPNSQLGVGTWVAWGTGRVPVAVDPAQTEFDGPEKTGGEKNHTLSASEMPSHRHGGTDHTHTGNTTSDGAHLHSQDQGYNTTDGSSWTTYRTGSATAAVGTPASGGHAHNIATNGASNTFTDYQGGGAAHNNLQPYITCYMWKRTA